jgi:hypothetical protein
MWLKLAKNYQKWIFFDFFEKVIFDYIRCKNVSNVFHVLKNVKIAQRSLKICQFWLYFMNLNHILKKVGRGRSQNLFLPASTRSVPPGIHFALLLLLVLVLLLLLLLLLLLGRPLIKLGTISADS